LIEDFGQYFCPICLTYECASHLKPYDISNDLTNEHALTRTRHEFEFLNITEKEIRNIAAGDWRFPHLKKWAQRVERFKSSIFWAS
jgi:hypothetical protein